MLPHEAYLFGLITSLIVLAIIGKILGRFLD